MEADSGDRLALLLSQILPRLPLLFVCLVGMVVALVYRARAPYAALLAGLGAALQFFVTSVSGVVFVVLTAPGSSYLQDHAALSRLLSTLGFAYAVLEAIAVGLLLLAAFQGRARSPAASGDARPEAR
ncbi:MAG: hypothetical protein IPJ77_13510 [Planctomycetes bacterium]|nr:hypothetical protein [Planctomycetota bacterium]